MDEIEKGGGSTGWRFSKIFGSVMVDFAVGKLG